MPKYSIEEFQKRRFDLITEIRRFIQKRVAKTANLIIVPSEYLKSIVKQWGIDKDKIKVIYNAVSLPKIEASKQEARAKLNPHYKKFGVGVNLSGTILISVGRLVPWKGFDALIEIMPDLIKQIPDLKLLIIGEGPEKKNYSLLVTRYGLQDNVFLLGKLPHNELLLYLRAADIFVLNTGYEGLPHQILEAMAAGLPVITTNIGGNPEIINHNKNGLLVKYNDKEQLRAAILKLIQNQDLQRQLVNNAKDSLQAFTLDKMINQTIKLLKLSLTT